MRQPNAAVLTVESPQEMQALGSSLAAVLPRAGDSAFVITLSGELGVGKTTLVRGILKGLGVEGVVRSPTYTLIEPYELAGTRIYHLDLYRVADANDLEGLGLRDLLDADSILLIEWPERGVGGLPAADLHIGLRYGDGASRRQVAVQPLTARGLRVTLSLGSVKHQQS